MNKIINENKSIEYPRIPEDIKLRDYQKEAINNWFKNKFNGILEMATGTGKTITAISAMVKVIEHCNLNNFPCGIVIVVPYKSLLEQWTKYLSRFNIFPIMCYDNKNLWINSIKVKIDAFNNNIIKNLFIITTNATFNRDEFQNLLSYIKNDYILCIDEMHHAATENYLSNLPRECKLRLGLSATLQSNHNKKNMDKLINYFDKIVYTFDMKRAIEEGFLTPYYYYPIFIELTEEERYEYLKLSKKIGKFMSICDEDDECLTSLLMKRARIIASAQNKLKVLKSMKKYVENTHFNIFYCGDKIENNDKYIYKVNRIVANDLGLKTHTFTSEEHKYERQKILQDFKDKKLDAISAIRCLDEGIDIPDLRRAFILSSSTNPKEFIQRRGRILRKAENKEFAEIYDFIVVSSLDQEYIRGLSYEELDIEKRILSRELERFNEFCNLAINSIDAHKKLMDVWDLYDN